MKEIWKDIKGYEGLYKISNTGRVKSFHYNREKILQPLISVRGYYKYTLVKNKTKKQCFMHQLIATAFIPNPNNYPCVNHINGNKKDNRIDNLEWCTIKENNQHAYKTGLNKGVRSYDNVCSKTVLQYDMQGNFIKEWGSTMDIQRELNIANSCISACCLGQYKQSHNFIWKYKEEVI